MAGIELGEAVERRIVRLRGQSVMLDADLAQLYRVETKDLNRAVKRNSGRFPLDFMFQLTRNEAMALRCHSGTSKPDLRVARVMGRGGRRYLPYAFTEEGVAMLSSVLRGKTAVMVNVEIMRAFVRLRGIMGEHRDLSRKLDALERRHDAQFRVVFEAIRKLMQPAPLASTRRIGFHRGK